MTDQTLAAPPSPSFDELTRVFARIGLLSFGGPAGQISLMHRELVEERRWLSEARFLHALNYCMLLPGPEAMQLATYAGWLLHGVRGGLVAGLLFVLPGACVITVLSALYFHAADVPLVSGLLFGIQAAVIAIVVEALIRVSKRALKGPAMVMIALAAFVAIALLKVPFPLIVIGAGVIGIIIGRSPIREPVIAPMDDASLAEWTQPSIARFASTLAVWLAIWFVPLALLHLAFPFDHVLPEAGRFFSVMATVTFGGAYAVLAFVAQQAVDAYGWLQPGEMLTGLGLAETTPGPLILVLAFVGFLGGARFSSFEPLIGGMAGVAVTLWFTFVPCFLWIFVGAPAIETLRNVRWLANALAAVTAAVVGIIANLAFWFGLHVLFGTVEDRTVGPLTIPVPELANFNIAAAVIAAASMVALLWLRVPMLAVLGGAAAAGMLYSVI